MLVRNSQSFVTSTAELFDAQSGVDPKGNHPRTAIGLTQDGLLIMVVVDGRRDDATGINLKDLSQLLVDLGATAAMNLDGGGSSTFVVNGNAQNKPSDGEERPVSSTFCIR